MTLVYMYTFYRDIRPTTISNSHENISLQAVRDRTLFQIIHRIYNIPRFPMTQRSFDRYKPLLELISSNVDVNFLFEIRDRGCIILNNGEYREFQDRENAIREIYGITIDDYITVPV